MLSITMPRGDTKVIRFQIYDPSTGEITQTDFDEIYFSVKRNVNDRDVLFQKRLSSGEIEKLGIGDYQIKIDGIDTDPLDFNRTYPFDIELIYNGDKKTEYGEMELTPEVTCVWNEVG